MNYKESPNPQSPRHYHNDGADYSSSWWEGKRVGKTPQVSENLRGLGQKPLFSEDRGINCCWRANWTAMASSAPLSPNSLYWASPSLSQTGVGAAGWSVTWAK
ncbi:MAG: hypothetical protein L0322_29970 [Chloroflexi bacterium]|nr:hypothetical protein [Chloroflexota bacterium]